MSFIFTDDFQTKLLKILIEDYDISLYDTAVVEPEYFESPVTAKCVSSLKYLYNKYGLPLTYTSLESHLRNTTGATEWPQFERMLVDIQRVTVDPTERQYIIDSVVRFGKEQALRLAIRRSLEDLQKGNIDSIVDRITEAYSVGDTIADDDVHFFDEAIDRGKARTENSKPVIRTLISELDANFRDHGIARGELAVILAPPGRGKSMSLLHMAKAGIIQNKNVVFYSLQTPIEMLTDRLDSSFSGVKVSELNDRSQEVANRVKSMADIFGGRLVFKFYPPKAATPSIISRHLKSLQAQGFNPDMVIIDYADLMSSDISPDKTGSRYYELGSVYESLVTLAHEFEVLVWTASQGRRSSLETEVLSIDSMSESFEKAMVSTVIISLNQTQKEKEEQVMRLFIAKNSFGRDSVGIRINTAYDKGCFYHKVFTP